MSRGIEAIAVWTQVPVASRTVEVNTKTGFSLTAGSYSVRASSVQVGTITVSGATSNTGAVSSVTTTRAIAHNQGCDCNVDTNIDLLRLNLTSATVVTATRTQTGNQGIVAFAVNELL